MQSALYASGKSKRGAPTSCVPSPTSSMSDPAQTDHDAIRELDVLVRHLAEELAAFRRRALTAESKLKDVEAHEGGAMALDLSARVNELEKENEQLRTRLEAATGRAKQMLERVRFLRQQAQGSGGDR